MKFEDSIVGQKSYQFAIDVVKISREVKNEKNEYDLGKTTFKVWNFNWGKCF